MEEGSGYSPRDLIILIANLPVESATVSALRGGDEYRGWGVDRYMMANLIDHVQENTYVLRAANSKRKPEEPKATYRPGRKNEDKPKTNTFASMAAAFFNAASKE